MTHAQDLLHCQRCTVYIIDKTVNDDSDEVSNINHVIFCDEITRSFVFKNKKDVKKLS